MICPNCSKDFFKTGRQKYCSPQCCGKYWRKKNYKKYLQQSLKSAMKKYYSMSVEERRKKRNSDYHKYLKKCDRWVNNNIVRCLTRYRFNKDKEKCSKCDSKENLEFHHYSMKVSDFIIVCKKCHRKIHNLGEDNGIKSKR